jgi:hypothetical protein
MVIGGMEQLLRDWNLRVYLSSSMGLIGFWCFLPLQGHCFTQAAYCSRYRAHVPSNDAGMIANSATTNSRGGMPPLFFEDELPNQSQLTPILGHWLHFVIDSI